MSVVRNMLCIAFSREVIIHGDNENIIVASRDGFHGIESHDGLRAQLDGPGKYVR